MLVGNAAVLDYSDLRPYKLDLENSPDFPVYPDLERTLASRSREHQPDDVIRHVMAVCSGYSYGSIDSTLHEPHALNGVNALSAMMVRLGLPENRCRIISETVDAMLVCSTTYILQSRNRDVVIVAYRGTEFSNIISWLVDINVHARDQAVLELGRSGYEAHVGFYRNVRATRFEVLRTLQYAMARRPLEEVDTFRERKEAPPMLAPGEKPPALYITGHSLGGAMAAILAMMLMTDPEYREPLGALIRGVYTFGQPMVGTRKLAAGYEEIDPKYRAPVVRYVFGQDPIPHLPSRDIGEFAHFGEEYRYNEAEEKWAKSGHSKQMGSILGMGAALLAFPLGQLPFLGGAFPYTIADHLPVYYIDTLSLGRSEYGDDLIHMRPHAPMLPIPVPVPSPRLAHVPRLEPYLARLPTPIPLPFLSVNGRDGRPHLSPLRVNPMRVNPIRVMANLLRT